MTCIFERAHGVPAGQRRHMCAHHAPCLDDMARRQVLAAGMGRSVSTRGAVADTAAFTVGELAQVLRVDGGLVQPVRVVSVLQFRQRSAARALPPLHLNRRARTS